MSDVLQEASEKRLAADIQEREEKQLKTLLAHFETVTSNPRSMGYLRFLLKHYGSKPHPWTECYKDNFKRFGPKTKGLCGVLKDIIRQNTHWRHGPPKGPHPDHPDSGTPGVAIGEADKGAAKPPWGPWMIPYEKAHGKLSAEDVDAVEEVERVLLDISENCDPCRVLLGLDPAPVPSASFLEEHMEMAA
jgi:hypothetical protein